LGRIVNGLNGPACPGTQGQRDDRYGQLEAIIWTDCTSRVPPLLLVLVLSDAPLDEVPLDDVDVVGALPLVAVVVDADFAPF